jgi:CheY-like chemotaxis protein
MPGAIDLLLTDVVTPLMRGGQLAQEFRVIRPGAKVLFMSAYNIDQVQAYRVKLAPGEPFLKKPFTMDELQRAVKAALVYRPLVT